MLAIVGHAFGHPPMIPLVEGIEKGLNDARLEIFHFVLHCLRCLLGHSICVPWPCLCVHSSPHAPTQKRTLMYQI